MENNENEVQKQEDTFTSSEGGFTQAPTNQGTVDGQQPVYNQQPVYAQQPVQPEESKGFAIAGMVLGIVSLVCCCAAPFNAILAIAGIVLSVLVLVQKKPGKGMAIAGIICSAVALVLVILIVVGLTSGTFMEDFQRGFEQGYNSTYNW